MPMNDTLMPQSGIAKIVMSRGLYDRVRQYEKAKTIFPALGVKLGWSADLDDAEVLFLDRRGNIVRQMAVQPLDQ